MGGPGQMEGGWLRSRSINLRHERYLAIPVWRLLSLYYSTRHLSSSHYGGLRALDQARHTN